MHHRRSILLSIILLLILLTSGQLRVAAGADYPTKPITLIIPFPPRWWG